MFPEGTFHWEAQPLDGQPITRETAKVSAESLDLKTLKWFRIHSKATLFLGELQSEKGINLFGVHFDSSEIRITSPARFSKIKFIKRKMFPMDMSAPVREIYLLKLIGVDEEIVIVIEPGLTRVLRQEPVVGGR